MQYIIHEANLERLEKKLTRIRKHCEKSGLPFNYAVLAEKFEEIKNDKGIKVLHRFIVIDVAGNTSLDGWEFIASIAHIDGGNVINNISGSDLPEHYRTASSICEHCNSHRLRKTTYVLRAVESGEFKQVGNSCLAHFIGGVSAESYARYLDMLHECVVEAGEYIGCPSRCNWEYTEEYLMSVAECVRLFGYHKKGEEGQEATAWRAQRFLRCNDLSEYDEELIKDSGFNWNTEANRETVRAALVWLNEQEATNEYMHNLKAACKDEVFELKLSGYVASLLPTWYRELHKLEEKRVKERELPTTEYFGEVGQRITETGVALRFITGWETDYGFTRLYSMTKGSVVFIWKTGKEIEDGVYTVCGTITEHKEFRGVNQTVLTRCKIS